MKRYHLKFDLHLQFITLLKALVCVGIFVCDSTSLLKGPAVISALQYDETATVLVTSLSSNIRFLIFYRLLGNVVVQQYDQLARYVHNHHRISQLFNLVQLTI